MFAKNDQIIRQLLADPNYRVQPNGCVEKIKNYRDMKMIKGAVKPIWKSVGYISSTGRKLVHYRGKDLLQIRIVWAALVGDLNPQCLIIPRDGNHKNTDPLNLIEQRFREIEITRYQAGKRAANAKLTWNDATAIRNDWNTGEYTQKKLSEKYQVSQNAVSLIVNNKTYKNKINHDGGKD